MKKYYVVFEIEADSLSSAYAEASKLFSECEPDIVEWGIIPENDKKFPKKIKKTT